MTSRDAPYKLLQRERAAQRVLATSDELRDYQNVKGISALKIARLAKVRLDGG